MVTGLSDALLEIGLSMENIVHERFDYSAGVASRQDRHHTRQFALIGTILDLGATAFALA